MKHSEIYDKHADRRKSCGKPKKFKEGKDLDARQRRVSFKNYVRALEEELLEQDLNTDYADDDTAV
jgi:hypothetical protein